MRKPFRIVPELPPNAFKTYGIAAPRNTHFREAACEEINCSNYLNGWQTVIDESNDLGQRQAFYIRKSSKRGFSEERLASGLTKFVFESGQKCFAAHQTRIDKPAIFLVRGGDWRETVGETKFHKNSNNWVEDFAEHQDKLANQ